MYLVPTNIDPTLLIESCQASDFDIYNAISQKFVFSDDRFILIERNWY